MQNTPLHLLPRGRGLERLGDIVAAMPLRFECDTFYFLRHGQTECNVRRIFQSSQEPLNETGLGQAMRAAEVLGLETISTIVCSDMHRTHHTARVVAERHALEPIGHSGLRERNFGAMVGSSSVDIDWDCAPANGETLDMFAQRVHAGLHDALSHPGPVLVVGHGGTLYVISAMLGLDITPGLLANAHPLRLDRSAVGAWQATALLESFETGINLA